MKSLFGTPFFARRRAAPLAALATLVLTLVQGSSVMAGDSASFQFAIAKLHAAEGDGEAAAEAFRRAVELDPESPDLKVEYAAFLASRRQLSEAAAVVAAALLRAPDHPEALRLSGQIHWVLSRADEGSLGEARRALERLREVAPDDVVGLATLGQLYERIGEFDAAIEVYRGLVASNTDNEQLKRLLVDALNRAGRTEEARAELREIVALEQASTENRLRLAELEAQKGDPERAIQLLREGGEELLRQPVIAEFLARQYVARASSPGLAASERAKSLEEALAALHAAEAANGRTAIELEARVLHGLERSDEALEVIEEAWRKNTGEVWPSFLLARELVRHDQWERASTTLEAALDLFGDDSEVRQQLLDELIQIDADRGAWDRATEWSERLLAAVEAPLRPYAVERRAIVLASAGDLKKALKLVRRERRDEPPVLATYRLLARLHLIVGDRKGAAEVLGQAEVGELARDADFAESLALAGLEFEADLLSSGESRIARLLEDASLEQQLAVGQFYAATGHFELAVPVLERAEEEAEAQARSAPDESAESAGPARGATEAGESDELLADARFLLAQSLERTGDIDRAARVFRQVLRQRPDDTVTMNYLGYMLAEADRELDAALDLVQRAVELHPENGSYVDSLGWVLYRLSRYEEALEELQRANRLSPGNAVILEHLGDAQRALGRDQEALASYRRASDLEDPENVDQVQLKMVELERALEDRR